MGKCVRSVCLALFCVPLVLHPCAFGCCPVLVVSCPVVEVVVRVVRWGLRLPPQVQNVVGMQILQHEQ